jgi:hypothetical protein
MPTKNRDGQETGPLSLINIPGAAFPLPIPCVLEATGPDDDNAVVGPLRRGRIRSEAKDLWLEAANRETVLRRLNKGLIMLKFQTPFSKRTSRKLVGTKQ